MTQGLRMKKQYEGKTKNPNKETKRGAKPKYIHGPTKRLREHSPPIQRSHIVERIKKVYLARMHQHEV